MAGSNRKTIILLGIEIDILTQETLYQAVRDLISKGDKHIISYVNIHTINTACKDNLLREFYRRSSLTYCDGSGIVWASRLLNACLPERMTGATFIYDFCNRWQDDGITLFFLGGRQGIAEKASQELVKIFPRLKIAGQHHGYFTRNSKEEVQLLKKISQLQPDILFLGFGTPEQEHWLMRNIERVDAKVFWTIGALTDYIAGVVPRCPKLMQKLDMEWLFRLIIEPRRLFKRYIVGNPLFFIRVLGERVSRQ